MKENKLTIKGYLHGTCYRYFVCATARWLKVKGTVKNLDNGDVEILCECNDNNHFEKFKKEITLNGTDIFSANVKTIEIEDVSNLKLEYFDVDYGGDVSNKEIATKINIGSSIMNSIWLDINTLNVKYGSLDDSLKELVKVFKNDYDITMQPKKKEVLKK